MWWLLPVREPCVTGAAACLSRDCFGGAGRQLTPLTCCQLERRGPRPEPAFPSSASPALSQSSAPRLWVMLGEPDAAVETLSRLQLDFEFRCGASPSFLLTCLRCRAKLASLFGLDQNAGQGNESFQYTAPKQPRKSSTAGETPTHRRESPQRVCKQQD